MEHWSFPLSRLGKFSRRASTKAGANRRFRGTVSTTAKATEEIDILRRSPLLDPVWYRQSHPDLCRSPIDVARHYLEYGADEGRDPGPHFDTKYYLEQNPEVAADGINPLLHYILRGAAEGRKPNPHFDPPPSQQQTIEINESAVPAVESPLKIEATVEPVAYPVVNSRQHIEMSSGGVDPIRNQIAEHFDSDFYLDRYDDIATANVDPLKHYLSNGWKEGRDPAPWFSTAYYLKVNRDVAAANVNPFWHYIVAGESEGRPPKRINPRQELLEHVEPPEKEARDAVAVAVDDRITKQYLLERLRSIIGTASGLALSFSHSCYPRVAAGTELFIGDEQKRFNDNGFVYLHFSPLAFSVFITDASADRSLIRVTLNGEVIGVAAASEIARVLIRAGCEALSTRLLIVHCALGHSTGGLLSIFAALNPTSSYFWTHDFSSICTGYNLLRNHIEFCHAPPRGSVACSICVFDSSRLRNAEQLLKIFKAVDFTVIAPSRAAQDIWLNASDLPHKAAVVQEHCRVDYSAGLLRNRRAPEKVGLPGHTVKVAFAGYPVAHKGWPSFERLVEESRRDRAYEFFHFGRQGGEDRSRRIRAIEVIVSSERRNAMVDLLKEHEIDIVVILSPMPETFSYVTFEALAAGCDIVAFADSGNVAATIQRTRRGRVFGDEDELVEFFTSHRALELVRSRATQPNPCGSLVHSGTTAAIVLNTVT